MKAQALGPLRIATLFVVAVGMGLTGYARSASADMPLSDAACWPSSQIPGWFTYTQMNSYWSAIGVNYAVSDGASRSLTLYNGDGGYVFSRSSTLPYQFIIGDFTNWGAGDYRACVDGAAANYVVEWEDGPEWFPVGDELSGTVGGPWGDCGVVKVWDLPLIAGRTYQFILSTSGADLRVELFRNSFPTAIYFGTDGQGDFQIGAGSTSYTAPLTEHYGLALFNASAGSPAGSWTLRVQEVAVPLTSDMCQSWNEVPRIFAFTQLTNYWSCVAMNPAIADNKDLALYDNPFGAGPPLAASMGNATDFIVGDFNHSPMTPYYPRVSSGNPVANYLIEWEDGSDILTPPATLSVSMGGGGGVGCGLARAWDLLLESGKTYRFLLLRNSGTADGHVALFRNPGSAPYFAARNAAQFDLSYTQTSTAWTAPATDWYGLVVFNASEGSPSGEFTLRVQEAPATLASGVCRTSTALPGLYSFTQSQTYWAGVAVNPASGDDKDLSVFNNPDALGSPLMTSVLGSGTDYIVGDFNHTSTGAWYPMISYGSTSAAYAIDWDDGADVLPLGTTVSGSVGGQESGCGLIKVWDVTFQNNHSYRITLTSTGSADIRAAIHRNAGSGPYWANRSMAVQELTTAQTPWMYQASGTDSYGIVVFNNSPGSPAGSWTFRIDDLVSGVEDELALTPGTWFRNPYETDAPILVVAGQDRATARVQLYNLSGELVRTLLDGTLDGRTRRIAWDGRTNAGRQAGSGIYFLSAEVGRERYRGKLVLVR